MLESFKIKVLLKKADSLFNQEKYDDSLIYYEKILSLNNNHIKSLYRKAYIFYIWKSLCCHSARLIKCQSRNVCAINICC